MQPHKILSKFLSESIGNFLSFLIVFDVWSDLTAKIFQDWN